MNNKGFTLIETLVVFSLLILVFALAFPLMDADMFYMDKMANEFVMDVRYVQAKNMADSMISYKIVIGKIEGNYRIIRGTVAEKKVEYKNRFKIDYSNDDPISFTYEGIPTNAGTFTIKDTKTHKIKEISIVPATGRTVIKE